MDALVVVHAEMSYLDPVEMDYDEWSIELNRQLFDRIAPEIGKYLSQGNKVYWLAEDDVPLDSKLIYPAFKQYFPSPNVVYISQERDFEEQSLVTKELLIRDGIEKAYISGIARLGCVRNLYYFLLGEDNPDFSRHYLEGMSREIGWLKERFDRLFDQKLDAYIQEDLTR